jgi:glycosyltransferase involved in cell wall biosynthesis/SAM-dependent methyltransferase
MQQQSLVRRAADEFKRQNYVAALDLYRRLAERIGERSFRANVLLCEKRLRALGRRDCTSLPLRAIKVACVMDEFTFHSFEPECELLPISPDTAVSELEAFCPDLLFIESAWRGKNEQWNRKISTLSPELRAVLQWCRRRQVPTVFWNKEDPVHFETFLTTAQQFDFVFTTDIDCIARYKAALGHERVYLLPFACQPKTHNPIELYPRKDAFCFAGAYYVRYPERTRDLENYVAEFPKYKPLEIFDRNFGKDDVNYQFPPEYQPYIVGTLPFNEIDKAYKGYRYSINLNSIKQSQTMFARRVYELLGSNTITVSNFSRGVRLLFGDLVISSDSGNEIVGRLKDMDEESEQKLRLAGLRKVMREHTYGHRMAYVARKALGWKVEDDLPSIVVVALARSLEEYDRLIESFRTQRYASKRLVIVSREVPEGDSQYGETIRRSITVLPPELAAETYLGNVADQAGWFALMTGDDYYGPNYLLDLAVATRYCTFDAIGKLARYRCEGGSIDLLDPERAYCLVDRLPVRSCIVRSNAVPREYDLASWLERACSREWKLPGLAIDPFNYCQNGWHVSAIDSIKQRVIDLPLDNGLPIAELLAAAEDIPPADFDDTSTPKWNASKLLQVFGSIGHQLFEVDLSSGSLRIKSQLPDGQHEYLYARDELPVSALPGRDVLESYLDAAPGLDIQYVFVFYDQNKEKLGHIIHSANRNQTAALPAGVAFVRLGWRICGSGETCIKCLQWGHRGLESPKLLGRSETLLLTNHYPSYGDLYRNGFVHSRVKAYLTRGVHVDVFRLRLNEATSYQEFQNVDVVTGGQGALRKLLDSGNYKRVLVHFLSPEMWEVLERYPGLQKIVWAHGAEIHAWHRREFNYQSVLERTKARKEGERRLAFWRGVLQPIAPNLTMVFVSRHFAEEVFEDLGFRLPEDRYAVIHNPIDTDLFSYEAKPPEQRKRVLSIRPYSSRTYANDLSVKAIRKVAEQPCFRDMEFRMIGDGKLFEETLEPLRSLPNVTIERGFLTQKEIAKLHKEYGLLLIPTRTDSQGVSRDEAMASGLVPITSRVAAVPEFVDESCGILAPAESADALAEGIVRLYQSPALFDRLSKAATERVARQTASKLVIDQELGLFSRVAASRHQGLDAGYEISGKAKHPVADRKGAGIGIKNDRPISFVSFDVEALPGRAESDPVDRLIWGRYDGEEYGIPRICRILNEYGIKGNFLIDFAACLLYGDNAVREVADFLLSQGHEVHVHLHSEWVVRKWMLSNVAWAGGPVGMEMLDEALNQSLLQFAAFKYRSLVRQDPVMFRAGGYRFNAATVTAAHNLGFKACSNFNSERHAAIWDSKEPAIVNNEPFRWQNGLIELPVDLSPEPLNHDWEKYQGSFARVLSRKTIKTFNLTMHSWTLLTRGTGEHFTGFSPAHEVRLREICEHLKENSHPMGYSEYLSACPDLPTADDCRCVLNPATYPEPTTSCTVCGATYGKPLSNDICPSCESRARHRQILDVLEKIGNPFEGCNVLACHANPVEMQAFLARANKVVNFDVRPLGYADLQMDIQSMDKIEDASFDTFIAIHVLNHVADDRKALSEIRRVLKPGGVALITVPCRDNAETESYRNVVEHYGEEALRKYGVGSYRRYGLENAKDLFSDYFQVVSYRGYDAMTNSYEHVFFLNN